MGEGVQRARRYKQFKREREELKKKVVQQKAQELKAKDDATALSKQGCATSPYSVEARRVAAVPQGDHSKQVVTVKHDNDHNAEASRARDAPKISSEIRFNKNVNTTNADSVSTTAQDAPALSKDEFDVSKNNNSTS